MNKSVTTSSKTANFRKEPPREYTSEFAPFIKLGLDLQPTLSGLWILIVFEYVGVSIFGFIFIFTDMVPAGIVSFGLGILAHVIILMIKNKRIRQIKFLLINAPLKQINVISDYINWSRQVNDSPQRILDLEIDGHRKIYKTYDHMLADEFRTGAYVLFHPKSKWILPLTYFERYEID